MNYSATMPGNNKHVYNMMLTVYNIPARFGITELVL